MVQLSGVRSPEYYQFAAFFHVWQRLPGLDFAGQQSHNGPFAELCGRQPKSLCRNKFRQIDRPRDLVFMIFDHIETLKKQYTDKYVVVTDGQPELKRFSGLTGMVKTVNMSGRALVEFDGYNN